MPKNTNQPWSQKRFAGGIADSSKENANFQIPDAFFFSRAIDYRTDPQALTLLPGALKESGSVITDLLKWADRVPATLTSYFYGNTGNIYSRTNAASWTNLHTIASSHGNGMAYFSGDDYLYYTSDSSLGRYGPIQGTPQFSDNFLKAQGGVPTNTNSASFVAASSQYLTAADSASLEITGDITLETYFKANSLPAVGSSMTLLGKWDESGTTRGYKLDLFGVSGYFGAGTDGSLTISSNTTQAPIDSACTGTAGTQTLSATNASFAVGQIILIHQTQGANAGQWERNIIQGYTAGTITLGTPLLGNYVSGAQVIVLLQYTNVTINSGIIWTAKAWNGTVGGILAFLANGTVTITGTISATGCGYRGGSGGSNATGTQGEGTSGVGAQAMAANGNSGGAGTGGISFGGGGGGGGGHANSGVTGGDGGTNGKGGTGGGTAGSSDLTTLVFGGAGGGGGAWNNSSGSVGGNGGNGGGVIFITGVTITTTGAVISSGANGTNGVSGRDAGGGGAGAGGSILLKAQTATLGSSLITASAGSAGSAGDGSGGNGGTASTGRIVLDYLTSYTGTTTPTLNPIQDNTLVTTTTIQARLGISNDGTAFEYLTQNLTNLTTGIWNRLSVAWKASTSMATFYLNAVALGTSTGTKTAISSNASLLYIGANKTSVVANFFDGLQDDIRIWANLQTAAQIFANNQIEINTSSSGLKAYYKLDNALTDATSNGNNLTNHSTTFSTDVPFPAPTTRLDIDTQNTNTGQLYTLPTSISEAGTDTLSFTPVNDPQSSVAFYVDTKGTGNWIVTVHDQQNNIVATQTILNANVPSGGAIEFIFTTPWRLISGKKYHMHLTVSTGTSKVVTGTIADFSTAEYTTYFGFLVTDTQFHPIVQFQYQPLGGTLTGATIIGNERYIAIWDGVNYLPNFIQFPPAWKIRCFGFWREYLAIGMWRGGNIYDFDAGRIYFWSGIAPAFDFFIDVPEGQINSLFGVDSDLYIFAGWRGYLLDYKGGFFYNTGNSESNKLKYIPKRSQADYFEIYPQALTMWRGLLHFGLAANSNSTTIERGVYSFGTYNQFYPETLSYDYPISTGNRGNTVNIGLVYPIGQNLVVGWQDGNAFGADVINFNNAPASQGTIETLILDDGIVWHDKQSYAARADFLPLKSGEGVAVDMSVNRSAYSSNISNTTVGDIFNKVQIAGGRGREIQLKATLTATTTSPTLLGMAIQHDPLPDEKKF